MLKDCLTLVELIWRGLVAASVNLVKGLRAAFGRWQQKIEQPKALTRYDFMPASWAGRVGWRTYVVGLFVIWLVLFVTDAPMQAMFANVDPATKRMFGTITHWGKSDWFLIPAGLYFFALCVMAMIAGTRFFKTLWVHSAAILGVVFLSIALSGIAVQILKAIFGRLRPGRAEAYEGFNFHPFAFDSAYTSMPSGHSTTAFAAAVSIYFLVPKLKWPMLVIAFLIIISRIVVSAHYPSDVYLGALLGTAFAVMVRHWMANRNLVFSYHQVPPTLRNNQSFLAWVKALAKRLEMRFLARTEPIHLTQNETKR